MKTEPGRIYILEGLIERYYYINFIYFFIFSSKSLTEKTCINLGSQN